MTSPLLQPRLIDQLGWTDRLDQVTRLSPGFSGAAVYRVAVHGLGEFALKRLPVGTDPSRVAMIHRTIESLREAGADGLPLFQRGAHQRGAQGSVFQIGSDLWEAASWQPGKPLSIDADVDKIASGARAIAAFHRVSMKHCRSTLRVDSASTRHHPAKQYRLGESSDNPPPCIAERIHRLSSITTDLPSPAIVSQRYLDMQGVTDMAMRNRFEEALAHAMAILQQGWPIVGNGLCQRLEHWAAIHTGQSNTGQPIDCCFVMRDIHREHALFDDHQIRFIDFDAARVDTPALDMARWIGSFLSQSRTDNDAVFAAAMAGYERENPSQVSDADDWIDLVRTLQQSGTWGSLANWVTWVAEGRRFDGGVDAVTSRISFVADAARIIV